MSTIDNKRLSSTLSSANASSFANRYSHSYRPSQSSGRGCMANTPSSLFPGLDDGLMSRQDDGHLKHGPCGRYPTAGHQVKADAMFAAHPAMTMTQASHQIDSMELLEPLCPSSIPSLTPNSPGHFHNQIYTHAVNAMMAPPHHMHSHSHSHLHSHHHHHHYSLQDGQSGISADPTELETFAEKFKQRRIRLGVTQADVGKALASLKLPGVGSLSQSTICRFESLTLSHNNMVALKPVLQAWLAAAEDQARCKKKDSSMPSLLPTSDDKKRKRTSIAAPEKRSLEAYFAVQQRPSGDKIAAIAEKLELKKSVVRVWFCNQRQKQKRMKYSACKR